jgi:hypothetical protein
MLSEFTIFKMNVLLSNHADMTEDEITDRLNEILASIGLLVIQCEDCNQEITTAQLAKRIFPIRITHGDCKVTK